MFILQKRKHIANNQIMLPGLLATLPLCQRRHGSSTAPALPVCV